MGTKAKAITWTFRILRTQKKILCAQIYLKYHRSLLLQILVLIKVVFLLPKQNVGVSNDDPQNIYQSDQRYNLK